MQKQRMKDLLFGTRVVVRTSNIRISRHRVADYVKKKKERKKFTKEHGARAFLSSFNQAYH